MTENDIIGAHETLLQFLYTSPAGLIQANTAGVVELMNPAAVEILMPLAVDGDVSNLFRLLETVAQDLRQKVEAFNLKAGTVCHGLRVRVEADRRGPIDPRIWSLTVVKIDADHLTVVLNDITDQPGGLRCCQESNEA